MIQTQTAAQGTLFGPTPLTLSQLTQVIGNAVRSTPMLQGAWVMAELSDVRVNGGHCYMELIEKSPTGQTMAKLRANVWASQFRVVQSKFMAATGRQIASGIKVMLYGSASHHPVYGLSFSVTDIDPSYTLGDMERLRREILEQLQREGVAQLNQTQRMPWAPQRVAVISAAGAAGYGDFVTQLQSNAEGFVFYPFLFPAVMQGERTAASVCAALELIEQTIDLWDCVVIIRGGGATTDLNGFDNYQLAHRVATFPLPVVVGIGHERDRTVLDEIAHTRCKTPTAVAAFLVDSLRQAYMRSAKCVDWIVRQCADRVAGERLRLHNSESMIPAVAQQRLGSARARLGAMASQLPMVAGRRTSAAQARLQSIAAMLPSLSANVTANAARRLDEVAGRIEMAASATQSRSKAKLERLESLVSALSPDNTLRRGYSVTRVDGHAVTDASQLRPGQTLTTQLHSGTVSSVVQ